MNVSSFRFSLRVLAVVAVLALVAGSGWAAAAATPALPGPTLSGNDMGALALSKQLYCQMKSAFSSPAGLMVGLAVALMGLWRVINGNFTSGLVLIMVGALLSAMPSLAESVLSGIGAAVSGFSTQPKINTPGC